MTKTEIIRELRRSACEDRSPNWDAKYPAWQVTLNFCLLHEDVCTLTQNICRTFFLLVAEALAS